MMVGGSALLVLSAVDLITMYIFPTEYYSRLLDRKLPNAQNYWWLRSPNTRWVDSTFDVATDGELHISNYISMYSYGRKDRRTRTTTSVHGTCDLVVTSTSTALVSLIPMDIIEFQISLFLEEY